MTICPCCGSSFEGNLEAGCTSCGARAIGPALPAPVRKLPAYEQAFLVVAVSLILAFAFLVSCVVAFVERGISPLSTEGFVTAFEDATWRLKYTLLPFSVLGLWANWRITRRMRREPTRFVGHRLAHAGLALTVIVLAVTVAGFAVNISELLCERRIAREAANSALLYASHRAILDYQARYGTYPATLEDLRKLPDADHSIARALDHLSASDYRPTAPPTAQLTATSRNRSGRGSTSNLRYANRRTNSQDGAVSSVSFNSYELAWPGEDKIFGTADGRVMQDGLLIEKSQYPSPRPSATATASPRAG